MSDPQVARHSASAAYYDQRWSNFEFANLYSLERCVFILNALLALQLENPRICDFGCGAGWLTNILSMFGPATGVDLSPAAVEQATARYPNAKFVCSEATAWKPEPKSFDVVVSQEVLEHIENKAAHLAVIRESLRDGGHLLMTTPNLDVLNAIPSEERKTVWEIQPVELPVTRSQLNALLRNAGFRIMHASSVVTGRGKLGVHRLLNSYKLNQLVAHTGLNGIWQWLLKNSGYGLYLTTVAQKLSTGD